MGCFTLQWLEQFLVWCVIVGAIIAIIRLVVPWILGQVGIPLLAQAVNIILWAVVCVFVIYIVFALLSCLIGMGGVSLLPPHR
jgi:hypothetical protein